MVKNYFSIEEDTPLIRHHRLVWGYPSHQTSQTRLGYPSHQTSQTRLGIPLSSDITDSFGIPLSSDITDSFGDTPLIRHHTLVWGYPSHQPRLIKHHRLCGPGIPCLSNITVCGYPTYLKSQTLFVDRPASHSAWEYQSHRASPTLLEDTLLIQSSAVHWQPGVPLPPLFQWRVM